MVMSIAQWNPKKEVGTQEKFVLKRCRQNRKLFSFLREYRREIFNDDFQQELMMMYRSTGAGKSPVCPAQMAMALILQGYLGISDADAVELTVVDLRWQMVLDCLGAEKPAFSQGTLHDFRQRLIKHDMDRRLLERTAELARSSKLFDAKKLPKTFRVAIDSSPFEGAGRVEDTINLIGHAARKVARAASTLMQIKFEKFCRRAGIEVLLQSSIKKALDCDWSDVEQKANAIDRLAQQVLSMERWISNNTPKDTEKTEVKTLLETLRLLQDQDLEVDADGHVQVARGVAHDRQISIEDSEMRHGRKTKSKRFNGYKRHIAVDLDSKAIVACAVTPANQPEHEALPMVKNDIDAQSLTCSEAHFDRGYMGSHTVSEFTDGGTDILCKPWKTNTNGLFSKDDFAIDLNSQTITCPAGKTRPITLGKTIHFLAKQCEGCTLRPKCTTSTRGHGRTVRIRDDESLQLKLRQMSKTADGRQRFRERVPVEHALAHIGQRQGKRARYKGTRKNLYDLRRAACIQNLETAHRKAA